MVLGCQRSTWLEGPQRSADQLLPNGLCNCWLRLFGDRTVMKKYNIGSELETFLRERLAQRLQRLSASKRQLFEALEGKVHIPVERLLSAVTLCDGWLNDEPSKKYGFYSQKQYDYGGGFVYDTPRGAIVVTCVSNDPMNSGCMLDDIVLVGEVTKYVRGVGNRGRSIY